GSDRSLHVAVAGVLSPQATLQSYQGLVTYLGDRLGRPAQLVERRTYAEINDLIRSGQADIGLICGGAYVEGQRRFGMELLAAPQIEGQTIYYSDIIVPSGSQATSLADLQGKRFAFTDPLSNSGQLAPAYALMQLGATPERFFSQYTLTYSHDTSIQAVAEGVVDGAAVDSLVYEALARSNSVLIARTRIIERLGPYGIPPVVVRPGLDPELKARFRQTLLGMAGDPRGRAVLAQLGVDRFVDLSDAAYDSIRRMAEQVRWTR
ncbi:MAG: phosphate/phosphite/phosphonate ABC transporter substrate-binding protein, partial [Chloroflexota bacterium]|nr:phosphate/phosphite/phosphonate ABC transporter substrate-binding protein [Chloroflexota bacterium]